MADLEFSMSQAGIVALSTFLGGILTAVATRIKNGKADVASAHVQKDVVEEKACAKHLERNDLDHSIFFREINGLKVGAAAAAASSAAVKESLSDLSRQQHDNYEKLSSKIDELKK